MKLSYLLTKLTFLKSYNVAQKRAGLKKRVYSFLIDAFIILAFDAFAFLTIIVFADTPIKTVFTNNNSYFLEPFYFMFFFTAFFYYILQYYFFKKTVGCAVFGLKIVKHSSGKISLKDCFIRFTGAVLDFMTFFVYDAAAYINSKESFLPDTLSNTYLIVEDG